VFAALKTLHILAATLFLGNIITGLFWKAHGDRTGEPRVMAHTLDGIIRSDRWFTIPGVIAIVLFGISAAVVGRLPILATAWICQSIVLFTVSGLAFGFQVAPLQTRLRLLAQTAAAGGLWDPTLHRRLSLRCELWGLVAVVTPFMALGLMVFKPGS
jgi:uncharacterized membrane protein